MPLDYNPEDADQSMPEGTYPAKLNYVSDAKSKAGKPMQIWDFVVYDDNKSKEVVIKEYVSPAAAFKIEQLAKALGCESQFKARKFQAEDHVGERVALALIVEDDPQFGKKNRVGRILAPGDTSDAAPSRRPPPRQEAYSGEPAAAIKDEDVPF